VLAVFLPRAIARISSMLIPLPPGATLAGAAAGFAAGAGLGVGAASDLAAGAAAPPAAFLPRAAARMSSMLIPLPPGVTFADAADGFASAAGTDAAEAGLRAAAKIS